jgi:hypothetical protein
LSTTTGLASPQSSSENSVSEASSEKQALELANDECAKEELAKEEWANEASKAASPGAGRLRRRNSLLESFMPPIRFSSPLPPSMEGMSISWCRGAGFGVVLVVWLLFLENK